MVSHERSGTHFLMNSLAKCFGYIANPWINFDISTLPVNFYAPKNIVEYFEQFRGKTIVNIFKSHHPYAFFEQVLPSIIDEFHIFYVYRDPRDVMLSMWRYLNTLHWYEGPKTVSPKELIRQQPSGRLLRYQWNQEPSMIHRWRTHVDGWTLGVPENMRSRVTLIRFKDLAQNFEQVIRSIGQFFDSPSSFEKPSLNDSSVLPHLGLVGGHKDVFDAEDLKLFRDIAGPTMDRLGFDDAESQAASGETGINFSSVAPQLMSR